MAKEKKNREEIRKMAKSTNYPIGDFLVRVKNIAIARRKSMQVNSSKLIYSVAKALERAGYLTDVKKEGSDLAVKLVYKNKEPLLMDIKLISKPGLRIYMNVDELKKVKKPTIYIISTPQGVMTTKEAISKNAGGEVIAEVL